MYWFMCKAQRAHKLGLERSGWLTFEVLSKQLTPLSFGRDNKLGARVSAGTKAAGLSQAHQTYSYLLKFCAESGVY